jgi:hypothetical protein
MQTIYDQCTLPVNQLFSGNYLESKALYLHRFNQIPDYHYMSGIEGEKACLAFRAKYASLVRDQHQYKWFHKQEKKYTFSVCVLELQNQCLIEFGESYCEILHDGRQEPFLEEVTAMLQQFGERKKRKPCEINLLISDSDGLDLRTMEVKRTRLNLEMYYGEELARMDALIRKRLNTNNDKGVVLLHGIPGTGKTTYLRHLIGRMKKRVIFLSPGVTGKIDQPDFMELLLDNPNSVLVIEDAEQVLMDRRTNPGSSVASLLNMSDGLLSDMLNLQVICTFNSHLNLIDPALMRKKRLIARYEFGKLSVSQSQRLSDHLGFNNRINRPMTIAEICGQNEIQTTTPSVEVIGFRGRVLANEC